MLTPVAPLVGAWIEIGDLHQVSALAPVAPLVGAWIEITTFRGKSAICMSLLSWERGLKF